MLTGLALFIGSCLVVARAKSPAVIASFLVFLLFPLLFAMIEVLKGNVDLVFGYCNDRRAS